MLLVFVVCLNGAVQGETVDVNNFSFEYDVNGNPFTDNWYDDEGLLQAWSVDPCWGGTSGISSRDNSDTSEGDYCVMGQNMGGSLYQVLPHAMAADKRYILTFDAASWPGNNNNCDWAGREAMSSMFYPEDGNFPDVNHVELAGKTFLTPCAGIAGTATWSYDLTLSHVADGNAAGKSLGIKVGFPADGSRWSLMDNVRVDTFAREVAWGARPTDGASDVGQPITLIWEAGDYAQDVKTWTGEVWSFTVAPAAATNPSPGTATWDISILTDLSWTPGVEANEHEVYFSTDFNDVNDRDPCVMTVVVGANSYDPGALEFWRWYYWAVDEVNLLESPNTWPGPVWSFATKGFMSVDGFEYVSTTDLRAVWDDYTVNPSSGAEIGIQKLAPFVRDGNSLMYNYVNNFKSGGKYLGSWIDGDTTDFEVGADWTAGGAKALVLYFYGQAGNSITANDTMWVELEDTNSVSGVVRYDGDANDVAETGWHEWNIELSDFDACGVSLTNVDKVHIGFGGVQGSGAKNPGGGTGTVYFDDIEVWPSRCRPELVASDFDGNCRSDIWDLWKIGRRWLISEGNVPAEPAPDTSAGGLLVRYEFEETLGTTASDSSGNGYNGTVSTDLAWDATGGYDGNGCLNFTGPVDVEVPNSVWSFPMDEVTVSVWIKTESLTSAEVFAPFGGGDDGTGWADWWLLGMIYLSSYQAAEPIPGYVVNFRSSTQDSGAYDVITYEDPNTDGWQGWHHYAFVKNANRGVQSIYLDGELVTENYWAADRLIQPVDPNNDSFAIGYSGSTEWGWGVFTGRMDDFRIYDYALPHGQIVDLAGKALVDQPFLEDDAEVDANKDHMINFGDYDFMAEKWLQDPILWP
jgi:hypothetical protein